MVIISEDPDTVAKRLNKELPQPILTTFVCWHRDSNTQDEFSNRLRHHRISVLDDNNTHELILAYNDRILEKKDRCIIFYAYFR